MRVLWGENVQIVELGEFGHQGIDRELPVFFYTSSGAHLCEDYAKNMPLEFEVLCRRYVVVGRDGVLHELGRLVQEDSLIGAEVFALFERHSGALFAQE